MTGQAPRTPSEAGNPLRSTTLARLYLAQGHRDQAARMLDALIERNRGDGAALHLRERLLATATPAVAAVVDGLAIEVHWNGLNRGAGSPRYVVVVTHIAAGAFPRVGVTSVRCEQAEGHCAFDRPDAPGSAVIGMGWVGPDGFVADAVTSPLVWT